MIKLNWREIKPGIAHEVGIDYQLLRGQSLANPDVPTSCMQGMMYVAFAMLQPGQAYHNHVHDDHEEVYYIISGRGEIDIDGEVKPIRDGDIMYIGKNQYHSIRNTDENDFIEFLAFAAQC